MKLSYLIIGLSSILIGCKQAQTTQPTVASTITPELCQFDKAACGNDLIKLNISPEHAPSEQLLSLSLLLPDGHQINKASIAGRDMYMGQIPVNFDEQGRAQVIYGACATDHMVWRLTIELESNNGSHEIRHFDWLADAKPIERY